jgi:hypothetical protein
MYYYLTAGILADKPLQTAIVSCYIFFKTKISLEIISIQYISFFLDFTGVSAEWRLEGGEFLLRLENDILSAGLHLVFLDNRNTKVGCAV